jgi:hypothetical protein
MHASFTKLASVTVLQFTSCFHLIIIITIAYTEFSFLCIFIGFLEFHMKVFYVVLQVAAVFDKLML